MYRRILRIEYLSAVATFLALSLPEGASAGARLYTGSIQLKVGSFLTTPYVYRIPFGANLSYPNMNNLPTGNFVGTISISPLVFTLYANQMRLVTSLSDTDFPPHLTASFIESSFSGANATGSFAASSGPGNAVSGPLTSIPADRFGVSFQASSPHFGGTMRLLGFWTTRYEYYGLSGLSCYYNRIPWLCPFKTPLSPIGGSFGGSAKHSAYSGGTARPLTFFNETIWGFPWTTGTVKAFVPAVKGRPMDGLTLTAMGFDDRTSLGDGRIQLVSPFVVRRRADWGDPRDMVSYRAGTAVMTLNFVPEPARLIQLASGLLALAGLYHFSRRMRDD